MNDFSRYLNIRSAHSPVLSPPTKDGGRRVAFLSDITGTFQVWSADADPDSNEWPRQLTFFSDKVWEVHGSPSHFRLIAVSDVGGNEKQQFYLVSGYGGEDGHEVRRLTTEDDAIHRFGAWSHDGERILYASNRRNGVDFDLYEMQIDDGTVRLVAEMKGNRQIVAWSPDEQLVLVKHAIGPLEEKLGLIDSASGEEVQIEDPLAPARYSNGTWRDAGLFVVSDREDDSGAVYRLDPGQGELHRQLSLSDLAPKIEEHRAEIEHLALSRDGSTLVVGLNEEGYSRLWRIDIGENRQREIEGLPQGQIGHLTVTDEGLVIDIQTPVDPLDVWHLKWGSQPERITRSDRAGIDPATFVAPRLIRFESFDGQSIPAFFYRPQSDPPEGGYPTILYVHGGPASQLRPAFDVRFQYFLSRGYAILGTNVRGSSGYGRRYTAMDEIEKRMDSVTDLRYAVEWLRAQEEVNGERIAVYGRSYGGFMVLAALTEYPELFAAGIDVVGIANWVSFLERTSVWRRRHREGEYGSLEHDRAVLERISPIHRAERITMPLLVVAGDNDPRVPLFESEQIVERVRGAGGTVEFLHYADEGHLISKLPNRIDSFQKMAAFLDRYL